MKAVVLVGGFGTRLRPLTLDTPKQMLPVAHRPMIEWVVEHLARHEVDEVVLSLGFRPDHFISAYPDGTCCGISLSYAVEPTPLDTAGAIRFAATEAGIDERFLVVNGDVLTDADLSRLVDFHRRSGGLATISLTPVEDPSRYGVVVTDDRGKVLAFIEKPPAAEAPSNWINAGTYVVEPEFLERIPADRPCSVERETFPRMVEEGLLFALGDRSYWIDAGTPQTYVTAQLDLVGGRRGDRGLEWVAPDAVVDATAELDRAVVCSGAVVGAGSRLTECVVLPGARIGSGCSIRQSVVGPMAEVGDGTELDAWTVVGPHVRVEANSRLVGVRIPDPERSGKGSRESISEPEPSR
ncbi:MAG: hypothetical protein KatS3mg008_2105 [Acidimicrobiales bacterium]|nr:MAG: hypothetical protein KatS3mg008_2105 [Acidimicrobiales bacterium]